MSYVAEYSSSSPDNLHRQHLTESLCVTLVYVTALKHLIYHHIPTGDLTQDLYRSRSQVPASYASRPSGCELTTFDTYNSIRKWQDAINAIHVPTGRLVWIKRRANNRTDEDIIPQAYFQEPRETSLNRWISPGILKG